MIRMLGLILVAILTGCVATTKVIVKHQFPDEHIQYEFTKEWTKTYQEKNMNFPYCKVYGSVVEMNGKEWTFTKIENTKSNGVVCIFSDKNGKVAKLTQQEVEKAAGV